MNIINSKIITCWNNHKAELLALYGSEDKILSPILFPDDYISKCDILFVGLNPSFSLSFIQKVKDFDGNNYREADFLFMNIKNNENKLIEFEKHVNPFASSNADYCYKSYFNKIKSITDCCSCANAKTMDLFFYRSTTQSMFEKIKNSDFAKAQLNISLEMMESFNPKIIVVANAKASEIIREKYNSQLIFDDTIGTYTKNGVAILFSSAFSGQRALDNGSYGRLKWQVKMIFDK